MTAAPDPRFRDQLAEDCWAGTPWESAAKLAREVLLAEPASWVVYRIAAELARVQAAANQRAVEAPPELVPEPEYPGAHAGARWLRDRAATLTQPEPGAQGRLEIR